MKTYNLLGKEVRGRFGFPSGVVATNSDTARWMIKNIFQLGFYVGKSTTIEPREGNKEDIYIPPWNAVGYANPGLEEMIKEFCELKETTPDDVFLMPQIGESNEENFAYCAREFDKLEKVIDGIEINVSCPHADKGGILIGSDSKIVHSIISAVRKATKKPLIVKLNAGVPNIEEIAVAAIDAGANAISAINTLGGPYSELSNKFGGLSGPQIFPVTYKTVKRIKNKLPDVQMIVMGGIRGANDIKKLDEIDKNFFYAIGSAFKGMDSDEIRCYFDVLDDDFAKDTNNARGLTQQINLKYNPFIVKEVIQLSDSLKKIKFYENIYAEAGQFVFLKVGYTKEHELNDGTKLIERKEVAKPFSVANDNDGLELVVRKVGEATSKIFDLKENSVVRIRGPYGKSFEMPQNETIVYVGAGCGIAPIHHAATRHEGKKIFIIGATTATELVYRDELKSMGEVFVSTDDGSLEQEGYVTELLEKVLDEKQLNEDIHFFNCGPEVVLKKADEIERKYTSAENIYHLVERMTSCGTGICGKCSTPNGERACVDGPVFTAEEFTPGEYTRDKTGKKVEFNF